MESRISRMWWLPIVLLVAASGTQAAGVQRCIGESGEPVFSDRCSGSMSSQRRAPARYETGAGWVSSAGDCARSPDALANLARSAIRTRNPVRLSGLFLWQGVSGSTARGELRRVLGLMKAQWSDVALQADEPFDEASYINSLDAPPPPPPREWRLAVLSVRDVDGVPQSDERVFGVSKSRGCYWMTFNPEPPVRLPTDSTIAAANDPYR